jgi:PhnB protein
MAKKAKKAAAKKPVKKAAPKKVLAIPPGPQLIPFFSINNANAAIEFYKQVFGAKVKSLTYAPDGKTVAHSHLIIGNSQLFVADPMGPQPSAVTGGVFLYVKDTDAVFNKAIAQGAKQLMPVSNQFWGDRWGVFQDPFGNNWQIATHIEDVKPAEMARRAQQMMSGASSNSQMPPPPPSDASGVHQIAQA